MGPQMGMVKQLKLEGVFDGPQLTEVVLGPGVGPGHVTSPADL